MNKTVRAILGLLVCVNLLCGAHLQVFAQSPQTGAVQSAEEDAQKTELTISDAEGFLEFSENCRLNSYSYNLVVRLTSDIDLSGTGFECIPTFSGEFDGGGHTVSGLSVTTSGSVQGLFRYLRAEAVVHDLTVEGEITPGGSHSSVGGIAGVNAGRIENCRFSGRVSGSERVGGLAGVNELTGIIDGCLAAGEIHGDHFVGGIAGENRGVVRFCENKAQVNATAAQNSVDITDITIDSITGSEAAGTATDIGGIAGGSSGVIRECTNSGTVGYPHIGYNVGGIAGSQIGYITTCENHGNIYGRKEVGGIVGQMEPSTLIIYQEDALQVLYGQLQSMSSTIHSASAVVQSSAGQLGSQTGDLQGQIDTAFDAMGQLMPDGSGSLPDEDSAQAALNNLSGAMSSINGTVNDMAASGQDSVSELTDQLGKLLNQINGIGATIGSATENVGGSFTDISDADTETDTSGKVVDCTNHGSIDGDVNAGGITGAMSLENDLDPEDDLVSAGSSSMNFDCEMRAVVLRCENRGEVTVKRQRAGGIVGWVALGLVRECSVSGELNASAAQYVGGIAGQSSGYIRGCGTKCRLTGAGYVGGIAGQSDGTVTECLSMVRVDGAAEKTGAVLGYAGDIANDRDDVPVTDNFYFPVDRDIGGVDGISYDGAAQPMEREEFFGMENLPEMFRSVTIRFVCEDGSEKIISLAPGEALSVSDIPAIPEKTGFVGYWEGLDELDMSLIAFDTELTMVYEPLDSAVQSAVVRDNGMPLLLALGQFSADERLDAAELTGLDPLSEDTEFIEGWEFSVNGDSVITQLRCLLPEEIEAERISLSLRDASGEWHAAGFTADGSYIVFSVGEDDSAFRLDTLPNDHRMQYIAAGAGGGLLLLLIATALVRSRKKRSDIK